MTRANSLTHRAATLAAVASIAARVALVAGLQAASAVCRAVAGR